jgi:hypothetical protein
VREPWGNLDPRIKEKTTQTISKINQFVLDPLVGKMFKKSSKNLQKSTPRMLKKQFQKGSRRKKHEKCKNLQPSAVFGRLVVSTGVEHATTNVKTSYRKP